jgi:hypothetical protein
MQTLGTSSLMKLETHKVKKFNRRTYQNLSAFVVDLKKIMAKRDQMKPVMRGEVIDPAFRERLMLAVTVVNELIETY